MVKRMNHVELKKGYVLYADDRVVVAQTDTILFLPINVDFYIQKAQKNKSKDFYSKIQQKAFKNRWTQGLHNIVLDGSSTKPVTDTLQTAKSEIPFLPYRNFIIKNIQYKKLNVFGPTISEPDAHVKTDIGRFGNSLHVNTTDRVISKNLLFKKGEAIDPYTMADNERILRQLPFIEDARIVIENVSQSGDSADVIVFIKDVWSVGFDLNVNKFDEGRVELWDSNILGSGHEYSNGYYWNGSGRPATGIDGYYKINNLYGSFINFKLGYNAYGSQGYSVDFWRDFFTQRTKYAGELRIENNFTYNQVEMTDSTLNYVPVKYHKTDFWIGRAFPLEQLGIRTTSRANLIVAGAVYYTHYSLHPDVTEQTLYNYHNKTYYLLSLAYSTQGYYKSNLVYNYGRTEDIPYGTIIKLTHGYENAEFFSRLYNSIKITKGDYLANIGYLYGSIALGGFNRKTHFEQGTLQVNTTFFTNLLVFRQYKIRHFLNVNYTKGWRRFDDEYLSINDIYGIRGLRSDSTRGTQKLSINYEMVTFTPINLLGFRFAFFGYVDMGLIGNTYRNVFDNPVYSGMGIGCRIRNEKLVFKTFQIRLAYYPLMPKQSAGELFTISNDPRFRPYDFYVKSPEILQFK